jgi:hypothetical protein
MATLPRWAAGLMAATVACAPAVSQADCRAASSERTAAVIELYTSEGCDSCPPADRWLAGLKPGNASPVALAFHVDYWDRLGWRDRFASAAYTKRQYLQASRRGGEVVYTPQVLLQGRDFDAWRRGDAAAVIAAAGARPARAKIDLAVDSSTPDAVAIDLRVRIPDARDRARALIAVALTQDGLSSEVKAGENAGKRLAHEHVVRAFESGIAVGPDGELQRRLRFELPADRGPLSVVALAEDATTGDVLQALALPLCAR